MRILHVSWEFPPVLYGGLGRHVAALSAAQARAGHEVVVLTQHGDATPDVEDVDGVRILRAREPGPVEIRTFENLLPWVTSMQEGMRATGVDLVAQWTPDVVHAHDWVVGDAASAIAEAAGSPLVATLHATEAGRHAGWIVGEVSHAVHNAEVSLAHRADRVIVCSTSMRDEVDRALSDEPLPVSVVPNGVDLDEWTSTPEEVARAKAAHSIEPHAPLVVFCGRVVWEKGLQTVVEALPALLAEHPLLVLAVAGRGPFEEELRALADERGVSDAIRFVGFMPESELRPLIAAATCAVVPSLYEPFGMVAVEAAALGTTVVASDVGGLRDVIVDGTTGLLVPPADSAALALAVATVIDDPDLSARLEIAARERVALNYSWPLVASATIDVYRSCELGATGQPRSIPQADTRNRNVLTGEIAAP